MSELDYLSQMDYSLGYIASMTDEIELSIKDVLEELDSIRFTGEDNYILLNNLIDAMVENTKVLQAQYTALLFVIGTVGAVFVCILLYKFIKSFY